MMEFVRMTPALQTVIRVLYILAYQYSYIKDSRSKNYFVDIQKKLL